MAWRGTFDPALAAALSHFSVNSRPSMRNCLFIFIGIFVLITLYVGYRWTSARVAEERAKSKRETVAVERGDIGYTVVENGSIQAAQKVEVKSRVSGRLLRLAVREGDRVEKGDLIAIIDPQEVRLQAEQASAQLRGAEAGARRARLNIGQSEKELRTQLIQAEQRFIQAEREWREQPLLSRNQTEQARLAYENAMRNRDTLLQITHPQERVRVESALRSAEVQFANDKRELERRESLLRLGYVSQREVDAARSQVSASESALVRARDEMQRLDQKQQAEARTAADAVTDAKAALDTALARATLDKNKEQAYLDAKATYEQAKANFARIEQERASYQQAAAQADQIRSALADAQRQLNETEIRAPMSGVVTKRFIEEGELVAALSGFFAGTSIVEIGDLTDLQVDLEVNEIDVARISEGMPADIQIDAIPGRKLQGTIKRIAPSSSAEAVTGAMATVVKYKVEVRIEAGDERIKPGMSARCTMKSVLARNVLRVSVEYLGSDSDGRYVLLDKRDSKGKPLEPEKRRVKTGAMSVTHVEIRSGVSEGDILVKPEYSGPPRQGMMQMGADED